MRTVFVGSDETGRYRPMNAEELQREVERLEGERDHWRTLAEQHARERDAFRRTLADLLEIHPARIVAPVE
jgi:hypothetical protein